MVPSAPDILWDLCSDALRSELHVSDPEFDLAQPLISSFAESPASEDNCQVKALLLLILTPEAKATSSRSLPRLPN